MMKNHNSNIHSSTNSASFSINASKRIRAMHATRYDEMRCSPEEAEVRIRAFASMMGIILLNDYSYTAA